MMDGQIESDKINKNTLQILLKAFCPSCATLDTTSRNQIELVRASSKFKFVAIGQTVFFSVAATHPLNPYVNFYAYPLFFTITYRLYKHNLFSEIGIATERTTHNYIINFNHSDTCVSQYNC